MITALAFLLTVPFQRPAVRFDADGTRLKGIYVNEACILGDEVRTSGAYLIGSADGSDAQGRSITSVGGANGKMKSDDPARVAAPPYQLTWQAAGPGKVSFTMNVGPMPQDFATLSMPFDFGLKMMDRFAFDGSQYTVFSSENDGPVQANGGTYDSIRPLAEIRDLQQHLIGKVGGAMSDGPSSWAQVDGPYATVRVTITKSQSYQKVIFMNHPGTHNMEFGFGSMKKGQTASLSGILQVVPKAGPGSWFYDSTKEFNHQVGRPEADGWSVRVGDEREKYMCFGPYASEIGWGPRIATFRIMLDNVTFDDAKILTIDVSDAVSQQVLATMDLSRGDFARPMEYEDFSLRFMAPVGGRLEFRTLWHGASYARQQSVTVRKG